MVTAFRKQGISISGACPSKYGTVDKTERVLQCPDGVTNVRYCASIAVNVTIKTKGRGVPGVMPWNASAREGLEEEAGTIFCKHDVSPADHKCFQVQHRLGLGHECFQEAA